MRKKIPAPIIIICMFVLFLSINVSAANALQATSTATVPAAVTATALVQATPTVDPVKEALEIETLRHENNWWWVNLPAIISSALTMAGVVLAVVVGFYQWRKQHEAERKKQHADYLLEQAKLDEARFQSVVKGFGSERIEARVGAAILLLTFLREEYSQFYGQIFHLAVSLLRVRNVDPNVPEPMDAMSQALVIVLRRSFPLARGDTLSAFDPFTLDATKAQLDNAYLSKTDLRKIYLREAILRKAYFWDSQLQEAYFKHSDMAGAYFAYANLEKANLGDTILTGADFTGANLTNTRIENARSLQGTILRGVVGLSAEQLTTCAARGAIVDDVKIVEGK